MDMLDCLKDAAIDTVKLLPVLFAAYLLMEYLEHRAGERTRAALSKVGKVGPLLGSAAGVLPQCGFSGAAASLYAARVITAGTLISVFLATSDEMLPLLISGGVPVSKMLAIIGLKFVYGAAFGFLTDLIFIRKHETADITDICKKEHCDCEHGIVLSALKHTVKIALLVFAVSFGLGLLFFYGGSDAVTGLLDGRPVLGILLSALVGLIPNCSVSVLLTTLYVENAISFAVFMSGITVNAGIGLIVLFKFDRNVKNNILITALTFVFGAIAGALSGFIPV